VVLLVKQNGIITMRRCICALCQWVDPRGRFPQQFTHSFYLQRSQKRKNTVKLSVFFVLLGSQRIKATSKMLVKSTPGCNKVKFNSSQAFLTFSVVRPCPIQPCSTVTLKSCAILFEFEEKIEISYFLQPSGVGVLQNVKHS